MKGLFGAVPGLLLVPYPSVAGSLVQPQGWGHGAAWGAHLPQETSGNSPGGNSWGACRGRCGAELPSWVEGVGRIFQACFSIGFLQRHPLPLPNLQNRNREVHSLIPLYMRMRLSFEEGSFHRKKHPMYLRI